MKKAMLKDTFKEIKKTYKRFISILLMAMLGVGFFVGIKASSPNMRNKLDNYFDKQNVFDIRVVSTLGLTNEDIENIKRLDGVKEVYGVYDKDVIFEKDNTDYILNTMEYNEKVNLIEVLEGNLPENENECVVEQNFIYDLNMNIGDIIYIKDEKQEDEKEVYKRSKVSEDSTKLVTEVEHKEEDSRNKTTELKIVGIIKSPLYISMDRGSSKLGSGKVDYYIYISGNNIDSDIYSSIYITVNGAKELAIQTGQYKQLISNVKDELKNISSSREQARYNSLINEVTTKINDAEDELNIEKEKAEKEITKAEKEIQDAEDKIIKGENELNSNTKKVDKEFTDAENTLLAKEKEYQEGKIEAETGLRQAEEEKVNLENQLKQVNKGIEDIEAIYNSCDSATQLILDQQLKELEESKGQIENGIKTIKTVIEKTNKELENGKIQLEDARKELEKEKLTTYAKLETARKELYNAKIKLENGKKELEESKQEFADKVQEAEEKLLDAREKIKDIKKPRWYVLDRKEANAGYSSLMQDADSINNISKVFPIIFFIVATFMSLTSMTRMIDEQRTGIGTLKALGYNKFQISSKYIIYSTFATVLGGILGAALGYITIPPIILNAYRILYDVPSIPIVYDFSLVLLGLLVVMVCIVGGACYASYRKLRYVPAQLMRPKSPKPGKRVFLERINFIWKRLSFSQKVTLRNIFRYKKRFLMTILGIGGATALILVGFGIKNSISRITSTQYEKVYHYQMMLDLKNSIAEDERSNIINNLENEPQIENILCTSVQNINIIKNEETKAVQLMVISDKENVDNFITLKNSRAKQKYELEDNGIIITERISKILGIKKGDTILIKNEDDEEKEVLVFGITEHYVAHYIYMTDSLYEKLYGKDLQTNVILIKTKEIDQAKEEAIRKRIIKK